MDILKEWVRNIFLMIVGLSFIEIILPSGNMKKYLKFIFSVIILSVVVFPLYELKNIEISTFAEPYNYSEADENQIKRLDGIQTVQISEIYKSKIKEKIRELVIGEYPELKIKSVDVYINEKIDKKDFGEISAVVIWIDKNQESAYKEKIRNIISKNLNISREIILIRN